MKTLVFNTQGADRQFLEPFNGALEPPHELEFVSFPLNAQSVSLAKGFKAVSAFVNDDINANVIQKLVEGGTQFLALRCAGYNQVDLAAAKTHHLTIARVPAYSPYAVAEHTLALILSLNRRIHKAHARVREQNFSLEGLMGFDLNGKTVGLIGTGKIGHITAKILLGFGCQVLAYDLTPNPETQELGVRYCDLDEVVQQADILSLHCPLTPETHHIIDEQRISQMKAGVMLINTSRGGLVDTSAVITGLKSGKIGYLGLDVYEEEADLFFQDLSERVLQDDLFTRLQTFPNVLITAHQAYYTQEALQNIAHTTLENLSAFESGHPINEVS